MICVQVHKTLLSAKGKMLLEVDIEIENNRLVAIHGPSGSGKTTFLRLIAGLLQPEQGRIAMDGEVWLDTDRNVYLPPQQRDIGFVFQDYALFPNMSVRENLAFALKKQQNPAIIEELMEMTDLTGLANRRPAQLSGGQQQRVALARALVRQPKILLMDEPLSALDPEMRAHLQDYIRKTLQAFDVTTILVSHDVNEIVRMADRVLVMKNGKIEQTGNVQEVLLDKDITNQLQIIGVVADVFTEREIFYVKVIVGDNLLKIVLPEQEAHQLARGDRVMVDAPVNNSRVQKLP